MIRQALSALVLVACATSSAWAQKSPDDIYFGDRELQADDETQRTLDVLASNRPTGPSNKPVKVGERSIRFVFGDDLPTVVCAPMRVCDIALQPGEQVIGEPIVGDTRWTVSPGISGQPGSGSEVWHLYLTPKGVGVVSTLAVNTDRRAYHIQLASSRTEYVAHVTFSYPEDQAKKWAQFQQRYRRRDRGRGPATAKTNPNRSRRDDTDLSVLSFDYEIEGDEPSWRPVRVYNNAEHTIIEFPKHVRSAGIPSFVAVRHEGVFEDVPAPYNYRIHGNLIKVDGVPNIMHLIEGVGSSQVKVVIRRTSGDD